MNMELKPKGIPGFFEICPKIIEDERGRFVKTFHHDLFMANGLETRFTEEYYSFSRQGVLRGLHFQLPPHEHVKLVYCVSGEVVDVVVDLRIGSPSYGKHESTVLNAEKANLLYIPAGLAHGFYVTGETATMMYKVTTVYSAECDTGILWNSLDIRWPNAQPIVSARDSSFLPFSEFQSPFQYNESSR